MELETAVTTRPVGRQAGRLPGTSARGGMSTGFTHSTLHAVKSLPPPHRGWTGTHSSWRANAHSLSPLGRFWQMSCCCSPPQFLVPPQVCLLNVLFAVIIRVGLLKITVVSCASPSLASLTEDLHSDHRRLFPFVYGGRVGLPPGTAGRSGSRGGGTPGTGRLRAKGRERETKR